MAKVLTVEEVEAIKQWLGTPVWKWSNVAAPYSPQALLDSHEELRRRLTEACEYIRNPDGPYHLLGVDVARPGSHDQTGTPKAETFTENGNSTADGCTCGKLIRSLGCPEHGKPQKSEVSPAFGNSTPIHCHHPQLFPVCGCPSHKTPHIHIVNSKPR